MSLLELRGVTRRFGAHTVASEVDLTVPEGARMALIGPNGAGKSVLAGIIAGTLSPNEGKIIYGGQDITATSAARRARDGIARSFQTPRLFAGMSLRDNLRLAALSGRNRNRRWLRSAAAHAETEEEVESRIAALDLEPHADSPAERLKPAQRRLGELAMLLSMKPRLLVLDEPASGIPHAASQQVLDAIARLPASITVLMIEHDMQLVHQIASRIAVLVNGMLLAEGTPDQIRKNTDVRALYLGITDEFRR